MNLQAELAYIHARLSTLQRLPLPPQPPLRAQSPSQTSLPSFSEIASNSELASSSNMSLHFDQLQVQPQQISAEFTSFSSPSDQELDDGDLQALAREFVCRYLPGVRFKPPNSH